MEQIKNRQKFILIRVVIGAIVALKTIMLLLNGFSLVLANYSAKLSKLAADIGGENYKTIAIISLILNAIAIIGLIILLFRKSAGIIIYFIAILSNIVASFKKISFH